MKPRPSSDSGLVLTIVVITILMMLGLVAAVLSLAANQRLLSDELSSRHVRAYYRARGGVVEARWRIRNDQTADIGGGGTFTNAAYNPAPYFIDLDANAVHTARTDDDDVRVDIGALDAATGVRPVEVTGFE